MKLDQTFILNLEKSLLANKPFLKDRTIQAWTELNSGCYRVAAEWISWNNEDQTLNYSTAVKCIDRTLNTESNGTLHFISANDNRFGDNRVKFLVSGCGPKWDSSEWNTYRIETQLLEWECEKEFWNNSKNEETYTQIADFNCFNDVIKPLQEFEKYNSNHDFIYNKKGWAEYVFKLAGALFTDFTFDKNKSTASVLRFIKPLTKDVLFGFEFEKSKLNNLLPEYFNLIILTSDFDKKTDPKEYNFKPNNSIFSLGIYGNPFYYSPCIPMASYAVIEMAPDLLTPTIFYPPKYKRNFWDLGDGTFKIEHPKEYGEKLKRHAFYYVSALAFSSKGYIEYIEKSILDTILTPA